MKEFIKQNIIRIFCKHPLVTATKGATYKGSLNDKHRVECVVCDKVMYITGEEIKKRWWREKHCTCVFER